MPAKITEILCYSGTGNSLWAAHRLAAELAGHGITPVDLVICNLYPFAEVLARGVPRDDATAYSYYGRVADHYDPDEDNQNRLRIIVDSMIRIADYQRTGFECTDSCTADK